MTYPFTKPLLLALLALLLPAARAWADQEVSVAAAPGGTITASHPVAAEGTTVFLTVEPQPGYWLREGSLAVEMMGDASDADHPSLSRAEAPAIGAFLPVARHTPHLYSFRMPATAVEVSGSFIQLLTASATATESNSTTGQAHTITIEAGPTAEAAEAAIYRISVPTQSQATALTLAIPSAITDAQGRVYRVARIASDVLYGLTSVTEVILPDTDQPIGIAPHAFRIDSLGSDDPVHRVATVRTPLALLDDYALMPGLDDNLRHLKVKAIASPSNRFLTFSCGVDVILPDGLTPYYCAATQGQRVQLMEIGGRVVAANNGVVLACPGDAPAPFELTAKPNAGNTGITAPATYDAKTYPGNLLEPVIEATHYDSTGLYILSGNAFHPMASEPSATMTPACRAVLRISQTQ